MTTTDLQAGDRCLVDTNVLLRLAAAPILNDTTAFETVLKMRAIGVTLCVTFQNLSEFWNVSTRPRLRNGFGQSTTDAERMLREIEEGYTLLYDSQRTYREWPGLIHQYDVAGKQVHDARLAACVIAHELKAILTYNGTDFSRYPGCPVIDPSKEL